MKIKAGDKVRVIKDILGCATIKKGDVAEVEYSEYDKHYYLKDHLFYDISRGQYYLHKSEFELVEESKKYIWYLDDEDGTYFLCSGNYILKYNNKHGVFKETKKGESDHYLLTEEQARKSPFFDKFEKHNPFEEWYCIRMKDNEKDYLNLNMNDGSYFMGDDDEYDYYKVKFKEKEADEIIGTSSILYRELVEQY